MRKVLYKFVEKIKTHILCLMTFISEDGAVYEIMWENAVERDRPLIGNMAHALCNAG